MRSAAPPHAVAPVTTGRARLLLAALAVLAVGTLLRVGLVDRYGLWADEFFSLAIATGHSLEHPASEANPALGDYVEAAQALPPSAYARYLRHDTPPASLSRVVRAVLLSDASPPFYYLLLDGWTRAFGTSDAALRLFSVLWWPTCFPVLWSLAGKLGGRSAALPTCILFALSPVCVFYSTEGRMYSLLLFWVLATIRLTLALWEQGTSPGRLLLWVTTGACGLLTHYFFLFVWGAVVLWLLVHPGRAGRRVPLAGALLTLVLILPWYVLLPLNLSSWRVTGYWLTMRPSGYDPIATALRLPWSFLSVRWFWGVAAVWDWINAVVLTVLAVVSGWTLSHALFSVPRQLLWLWLLGPCLGLVVVDLLLGTYVTAIPRYALAAMPAALLLVGLSLGHLRPTLRAVLLAPLVLVHAVGVGHLYGMEARNFEDYRAVGKLLAEQTGASDVVIVHSIPSGVTGVARYMEESRASGTGVGYASWVGQLGQRRVPDDLEALAAGHKRILVVETHAVGEPAPERDWLLENARLVEERRIHGTTIHYFTPRDTAVFFGAQPSAGSTNASPTKLPDRQDTGQVRVR